VVGSTKTILFLCSDVYTIVFAEVVAFRSFLWHYSHRSRMSQSLQTLGVLHGSDLKALSGSAEANRERAKAELTRVLGFI
jgi:hypothetical protein